MVGVGPLGYDFQQGVERGDTACDDGVIVRKCKELMMLSLCLGIWP